MTLIVPAAIILSGVIIILLSLPLIRRKIPKNNRYGIRIKAAFESDDRWYEINAYGGRQLAIWGGIMASVGVAGFFVPADVAYIYGMVVIGVLALLLLVPAIQVSRFARRTSKLNASGVPGPKQGQ